MTRKPPALRGHLGRQLKQETLHSRFRATWRMRREKAESMNFKIQTDPAGTNLFGGLRAPRAQHGAAGGVHLLDDQVVQHHLPLGALQDVLLHRAARHEPGARSGLLWVARKDPPGLLLGWRKFHRRWRELECSSRLCCALSGKQAQGLAASNAPLSEGPLPPH
jgi:hypothetical protein